jgi:hypothetical protein
MKPRNAYTTPHRARRWNCRVSVDGQGDARTGARIVRQAFPELGLAGHARRAEGFTRAAELAALAWGRELDAAALETWGRAWRPWDYRISGIGSDDFTPARKARLRVLCHAIGRARRRAAAHAWAARYLFRGPR